MPKYQPGEIVDISIKSARVFSDDGHDLHISYETTTGHTGIVRLPSDGYGISVNLVAHGDWPPQPGDLWVSGEPGEYRTYWRVTTHNHVPECEQVGCNYRVDLHTGGERPYPLGLVVPAALRPMELVERTAQVQP